MMWFQKWGHYTSVLHLLGYYQDTVVEAVQKSTHSASEVRDVVSETTQAK